MTREPRIPMSPEESPQQRLVEVLDLPARPSSFESKVGYWNYAANEAPRKPSAKAVCLCQVEWSWSPAHSRLDIYYLHRGRTHWSLWCKYWSDDEGRWDWCALGCVPKQDVSQKLAALYLLLDLWVEEKKESDLDQYHWINEAEFLSVSEITAVAVTVWGRDGN